MKRRFIPVGESFARWKKEPGYATAYGALEGEFALASSLGWSLVGARGEAGMTREPGGAGDGDDAGGGGSAGEREGAAVDADAGAVCQGDAVAAADQL
jgi:hypothetical protein